MVAMIRIEDRVFLGFLIVATLAMMWVASPFSGAILWGLVAAIIFAPVNRALIRLLGGHRNTAAALTLILIVGLVIVPAFFLGSLLIDEAVTTYDTLSTERIDMGATLEAVRSGLPKPLLRLVDQVALSDLDRIEERLSSIITSALRVAAEKAVDITQSAFAFVIGLGIMLYLTYFLLRDGGEIADKISTRLPLRQASGRRCSKSLQRLSGQPSKAASSLRLCRAYWAALSFTCWIFGPRCCGAWSWACCRSSRPSGQG